MSGLDGKNLQVPGREFGDAAFHLGFNVGAGNIGQVGHGNCFCRAGDEVRVFETAEFRQAAGHIAGAAVEISGQLGHFGQRPAQGLFGGRGRTGGPDDLALGRKGLRVVGQDPDGRNAHVEREIGEVHRDPGRAVLVYHLPDQGLGGGIGVDAGAVKALAADDR